MMQLDLFDGVATSPPKIAKAEKLSAWEVEQREWERNRRVYRSGLPSDDAGLLNRAIDELKSYDAAVRSANYEGMVGGGNNIRAIGEHAFGLSVKEEERNGPPKGNKRFSCLHDAWDWISSAIAADNGIVPLFGQMGRFEISIAGCRVDFEYDGLFGICGGRAHIIEWDKPFFSETGYYSFQVCPRDYVIDAGKLDCRGWLERICTAQLTSGGKKKVTLTKAWPTYCLQWRQSREFVEKYDRSELWTQWGPEKHAEHWAVHDARQNDALRRMAEEGIDPDEVWKTRRGRA